MKVPNCLVETRGREVREKLLETPKGAGSFTGLAWIAEKIICMSALDENVAAPEVARVVAMPGVTLDSGYDGQRLAAPALVGRKRTCPVGYVLRDALNILHKSGDVGKNPVIDSLENVADGTAWIAATDGVCVINVPVPMRQTFRKITFDGEVARNHSKEGWGGWRRAIHENQKQ